MNNNEHIYIFTKPGDLKFAPYWGKVEEYLRKRSFNKNINELLIDAMDVEVARLTWVMQPLIPLKDAEKIADDILQIAITYVAIYPEISSEELYYLINDESIPLLNKYIGEEGVLRKFIAGLIDIFIRNFIKLKKGADTFCDLMFSDSIISDKLESVDNISALFAFISELRPNIYDEDYFNKSIEKDED